VSTLSHPISRGRNSEQPKIGLTIEHLWLGLPVFVIIWKSFVFPVPLLDFWWHLKAGEIIVASRSIPQTDLFSFTALGKTFILGNWLAEIAYYLIYRHGGLAFLIFVNAILLAGATIVLVRLCWECSGSARLAALTGLIAACSFPVSLRSQVFSFLFMSVYYLILDGYPAKRRKLIWGLPLLMMIWVNLHGAFVLGLALVGLFLGLEAIQSYAGCPSMPKRNLWMLGLVLILCCLATLANPVSYRIYSYIDAVMRDPSSQNLVLEWQPPRIDAAKGWVLFYGIFYLLLVTLIFAGRRPGLKDLGLFLCFSLLGMKASRNGVWFAIIATPILARYIATIDFSSMTAFMQKDDRKRPVDQSCMRDSSAVPKTQLYGLNLLIACASLAILALVSPWIRPNLYKTSLLDPRTPVKAMDYIERNRLAGNIMHPQIYGDYLIWRLWPLQHSFFDGRVHLFGESFVKNYSRIFADSEWEELLKPYRIRYLLLNKDGNHESSLRLINAARSSPHWVLLYEDGLSILFEACDRR